MDQAQVLLENAVKELYGLSVTPEITPSPANIPADYSTNLALKLSGTLHRPPLEIAEEISAKLNEASDSAFSFTVTPPGFINFISSDEYLIAKISQLGASFASNISSDEYAGQTVICEFSDPNPFKVLHVGHLYTSVVGDAISRLFAYAGARVIRANFGGDVGLHVAKTLYALRQAYDSPLTIDMISKAYVAGTRAYDSDPAAQSEIKELNQAIYRINAENLHDSPLAKLYWQGRELSYDYFKDFYARIGIKFDKYYPESTVVALGVEKVREGEAEGVYEKSEGAVIFDGDKYGLHTRVFINQAGVPTYETKDVGLLFTKWNDYHFDKSVVITGAEQSDYMKVVLKSVQQYAPELVERTTHLTHGLVKLPGNLKMSSREGNFLRAVDVLDLVQTAFETEYGKSDDIVTLGAIKYAFLKYKMGGDIIFDPAESVKMSGNSGPYLLYSCVRAKKILSKSATESTSGPSQPQALTSNERDLIKKLLAYQALLSEAVAEMAPHKVATYLYELAQTFSGFYENCPVTGPEGSAFRIKLVRTYLDTMTHGLDLLGIKIPEEM